MSLVGDRIKEELKKKTKAKVKKILTGVGLICPLSSRQVKYLK